MNLLRLASLTLVVLAISSIAMRKLEAQESLVAPYRAAALERWEKDIRNLEQLDQQEQDPPHGILFTGSSSIRRWKTIAEDMSPWSTIRRGYGGARFSDLAIFIDRIIGKHQFDAVVIFVGNDIAGTDQDKSPAEALALYKYIVGRIRVQHPHTPIFCIAVTPTSSRFDVWPKVQRMNQLIKEYSESSPDNQLYFISTAEHYLDEQGKPRDELFVDDRLHLNETGYDLWAQIIKSALAEVLSTPKS